jgi:hypothetical protein
VFFNSVNGSSAVGMIFRIGSYTYGPLLGLYGFGLFMKTKTAKDQFVPFICVLSPALTFLLSDNSKFLFSGYAFDNELIIINGLITFLGLLMISKPALEETRF